MALILLTITMVLGITTTTRARARRWPGFAQQEMHRRLSMIAAVFVALHVLTSVLDTYVDIGWAAVVVPFTSGYDSFWVGVGAISLDLMAAVFVTSLLRSRLRPGTWRAVHWLAYLCWPVALAHTFGMGTDSGRTLGDRARGGLRGRRAGGPGLAGGCRLSSDARRARRTPAVAGVPRQAPRARRPRRCGRALVVSVNQAVAAPGRYRILGHPADLAGHVACPRPAAAADLARAAVAGGLRRRARGVRTDRPGRSRVPRRRSKLAVTRAAGSGGTILVNAMEGEPASDKDKLLLIRSPHVVLDGAQLLAAATGAAQVIVCVPAGREQVAAATAHALAERAAAGWAPVAEQTGASARPFRRRRGVGVGAVGRERAGPSRRSDRTRGRPCASGAGRR